MIDFVGLIHNARGHGKTTAMAEAVKKIDGILMVRNTREAMRVTRQHGIKTLALGADTFGITKPILFDPDAVALIALEFEQRIERLEAELKKAKEASK